LFAVDEVFGAWGALLGEAGWGWLDGDVAGGVVLGAMNMLVVLVEGVGGLG
jgi:hypothetical protein